MTIELRQPIASALTETSGPTVLPVGAWAEGGALVRIAGPSAVGSLRAANFGSTSATNVAHGNSTPAAVGAQQYSGRVESVASGWKTDATAGPVEVRCGWETRPVQGAAAPTFQHVFSAKIGAAAWTDRIILTDGGNLLWATDGVGDIGAASANRPNNVYAKTSVRSAGAVITNNIYAGCMRINSTVAATGGGESGVLAIGYGLGTAGSGAPTFANVPDGYTACVWLTFNHNNKVTYVPGFQAP